MPPPRLRCRTSRPPGCCRRNSRPARRIFAAALALLDQVTAKDPNNAEAWLLKGQIQQNGTHDSVAALASYRKAVALRNDLMPAHQGIVALLVAAKDLDGAPTPMWPN